MTPAARYAAAIVILDRAMAGAPAERELTSWARGNRFAGSKDRAAIRDIVYDGLRNLRSYQHASGLDGARGVIVGQLIALDIDILDVFNGLGYAPLPLSGEEMVVVKRDKREMSRAVALDIPDWLEPVFDGDDDYMRLKNRAPIDLRVNLKKATREQAASSLLRDGIETDPVDGVVSALRVRGQTRKIPMAAAYINGTVELQDAGSQALVAAMNIPDGGRVLDYCAGGGGKTLAMASVASKTTQFQAYDLDQDRLKALSERAARAGVHVELLQNDPVGQSQTFDLVVLDVPCSGSGAWRRNPDAKWKLTQERLNELVLMQAKILSDAQPLVAQGGQISYMTCSLFQRENELQVKDFLLQNPDWVARISHIFGLKDGNDGFFISILERK
tara:strand:- start:4178 stop:5341 length:1164 start_codon:yes stop_codon:yes gene_type:complete